MTTIQLPEAFEFLFDPMRYKVMYGGRGGGKSYSVAIVLLLLGMKKKMRILCTRELQASINDSVHKLLADIILKNGWDNHYEILQSTIRHRTNGTEFLFKGLKHNITEIKGMEGIDIVWCEESENISDRSWELLIPTIRKKGSEIWVVFNPKNPTDPTYQRFVAAGRDDTIAKKVGWRDNNWFPDVLRKEMEELKNSDEDAYRHIWEGEFDTRHSGSIYAKLVDKARQEERICPVPYKNGVTVYAAWDLGKRHTTAIVFAQIVGREVRVIDFYEASGEDLPHYVELVKSKPYSVVNYLPHDAKHDRLGMSGSIKQQLTTMGLECKVLKMTSIQARIELARTLLNEAYIDDKKCKDMLHALMNYHYAYNEDLGRFKDKPVDDWSADAADAFGYMAQVLDKGVGQAKPVKPLPMPSLNSGSYMGI